MGEVAEGHLRVVERLDGLLRAEVGLGREARALGLRARDLQRRLLELLLEQRVRLLL